MQEKNFRTSVRNFEYGKKIKNQKKNLKLFFFLESLEFQENFVMEKMFSKLKFEFSKFKKFPIFFRKLANYIVKKVVI